MRKTIHRSIITFVTVTALAVFTPLNVVAADPPATVVDAFIDIVTTGRDQQKESFQFLEQNWQDNFAPMTIETVYLSRDPLTRIELVRLLERKSGQSFGLDLDRWYHWLWKQTWPPHPDYAQFKSRLYRLIDPKFEAYFANELPTKIRLDEIRWGGVPQDGIPPLRQPKMLAAKEATYLKDDHIVFGLQINGDTRAYPKRILAWHEMFVDTVGGEPVAGVYCTLCGTMILYKTTVAETVHYLGTSGFLYRSNKLMYDRATQSLWSTLAGKPAVGPLVDRGIQLERLSVVTTTWGEWRKRHPQTQVLSLDTGHRRDYSEGAAYRQYFATDELMFTVPETDDRLKNKDEILGLLLPHAPDKPVAIASHFLRKNPVHTEEVAGQRLVVLTDASGAHRAYEAKDVEFKAWDQTKTVKDSSGAEWTLTEDTLTAKDGRTLYRLPSHNAFWFGWYSAFKNTRLVQ